MTDKDTSKPIQTTQPSQGQPINKGLNVPKPPPTTQPGSGQVKTADDKGGK